MSNLFKRLSWEETLQQLTALGPPPVGIKSVYGPGNSGRILAEMFAKIHGLEVAENSREAGMFIDDEVFTGRTYRRLKATGPEKPFWALVWNCKRVQRQVMRDNKGDIIKQNGRPVLEPMFQLGKNDRGVIIDPMHREFYPMKTCPRGLDGAHILEQIRRGKTLSV